MALGISMRQKEQPRIKKLGPSLPMLKGVLKGGPPKVEMGHSNFLAIPTRDSNSHYVPGAPGIVLAPQNQSSCP